MANDITVDMSTFQPLKKEPEQTAPEQPQGISVDMSTFQPLQSGAQTATSAASKATGISAYEPPMWERFKSVFTEGIPQFSHRTVDDPKYGQEQFVTPEAAMTPLEQEKHPIATGVSEFAGGMSNPQMMAVMTASGGLGQLPGAAGKLLPRLVSAGFSADMVHSAFKEIPAFRAALAEGNASEAQRILTHMTMELGAAALGSQHAIMGEASGKPVFQGMDRAIRDMASRGEKVVGKHTKAAVDAATGAVKKVAEFPEKRAEAKAAAKTAKIKQEDFAEATADLRKVIGHDIPESTIRTWDAYLERHHGEFPIRNVGEAADATTLEIKGIDNMIKKAIDIIPEEPIATNVRADVEDGLRASEGYQAEGEAWVEKGLKAIEKYNIDDAKLSQADATRAVLNSVNDVSAAQNGFDRAALAKTDAGYLARKLAADSYREGVYNQLENYGIGDELGINVRELRRDQGDLIKVRNALEKQRKKGGVAVKGSHPKGTGKEMLREGIRSAAGATGATVGGTIGSTLGGVGTVAGAVAGHAAGRTYGAKLADSISPAADLTRDALIERRFGRKIAMRTPPDRIPVDLKAPPEAPLPPGQQELLTDPSTMFDVNQTDLADQAGVLGRANAQSVREAPFQAVLNDPAASAIEKAEAQGEIDAIRKTAPDRSTIRPDEPAGPPVPSAQEVADVKHAELERKSAPYNMILEDPGATAAEKAVAHGQLQKLHKVVDKAIKEAEKAEKESKPASDETKEKKPTTPTKAKQEVGEKQHKIETSDLTKRPEVMEDSRRAEVARLKEVVRNPDASPEEVATAQNQIDQHEHALSEAAKSRTIKMVKNQAPYFADRLGIKFLQILESVPGKPAVIMFQDPVSNGSLAVKSTEWNLPTLKRKLAERRAELKNAKPLGSPLTSE